MCSSYGFKLFTLSELMLSIACFRAFGNFRLCSSSSFFSFSFPLFSSYSFPLPFSNLLIPLYSSLALNGSQLFPKIGFMVNLIEGLGQSLSCGFVFICPQFKEFIYSYFPFSDCFIGSLYYFTTGLHGFHVRCGSFGLFPILLYSSSSSFNFCASYSIFPVYFNLCLQFSLHLLIFFILQSL